MLLISNYNNKGKKHKRVGLSKKMQGLIYYLTHILIRDEFIEIVKDDRKHIIVKIIRPRL